MIVSHFRFISEMIQGTRSNRTLSHHTSSNAIIANATSSNICQWPVMETLNKLRNHLRSKCKSDWDLEKCDLEPKSPECCAATARNRKVCRNKIRQTNDYRDLKQSKWSRNRSKKFNETVNANRAT